MAEQMQWPLRLRQICIVTPRLEAVSSDIRGIFGIEISHRDDEGLRRFGLENAVFVISNDFLEVQAPVERNTAAGRFIERTLGHGGYNVVIEVGDDVKRRQARAERMGIRIALEINRDLYQGVQLHPRDCRATMIEFARPTELGHQRGGWWPAGPEWRRFLRTTERMRILGAEVESPTPDELAAYWSDIIEAPLQQRGQDLTILLDNAGLHFVEGKTECLSAIIVEVEDVDRTLLRAVAHGYRVEDDSFHMGGVYFRLRTPGLLS